MRQSIVVSAVTLAGLISGCGSHLGLELEDVRATREADNRVTVEADVTMSLVGPDEWLEEVREVCATASWRAVPDVDGGMMAHEGGEPLFTAKSCTTDPWADRETKVLKMTSAEAIPTSPAMIITVELTATSSSEPHFVINDIENNSAPSP